MMNFVSLIVLGFPVLFSGAIAQFVQNGRCDFDPELTSFNLDAHLGTWYELARSPSVWLTADCSEVEITNDNGIYSLHNRAVNRNFLEEFNGTLDTDGSASLNLTVAGEENYIEFTVLMNLENSFILTYSCENLSDTQRSVHIWLLGASTADLAPLVQAGINSALTRVFGVVFDDLTPLDYSEDACYELPVIEEGEPIVLDGECDPNIRAVQNFDASRFLGLWHEISSYESESVQGTCARAEYSVVDEIITVLNSEVTNQALSTISGTAVLNSTDNSGRLLVTLEILPGVTVEQELVIIDTDYDSYAISYSCQNVNSNNKRIFSWILGRSRELTEETQVTVNAVVHSVIDLNFAYYQDTRRTDDDCFYFPEHVENQPVVFRGQCDLDIPVVADFNFVEYMGLWHDISSYPSIFQTGTCNNAHYTLNDGVVDVFNTQVIDESLDTIQGVAVSEDGGAKLRVTFPIPGTDLTTNISYWVIATNYNSYALVYSCENDGDNRRVWSWKLSRSKQLSVVDEEAISQAISGIQVLNDTYYEEKDQSASGCFYYPEHEVGVPVVFPGQCDEDIGVVENFNFTQFGGLWHEIEAYPRDGATGQCISHDYSSDGTLTSISILNQFMQTSNPVVNYTDSAKLEISFGSGDTSITLPFWILDTDYEEYALAYSCVNLNTDYRSINSWKLSRSRTLATTAAEAIYSVIQNIQVLNDTYFEAVEQTDDACFYLPDIPVGEPIILVGQCDPNITVMQNFNASQYQGLWHVIESYAADSQTGTCNDVNYSIENDGSITVINTQVINEVLYSLSGLVTLAEDGSGKLVVSYLNEIKEFWILDTDYVSYSIVYSCENISDDARRVWSWKLSRSTALTPDATTAINDIVDTINVLNNLYFEEVNNSDDACFYFPEPNGSPVIFRRQCDENITVVNDFSVVDYLGEWFDIERYPQSFQDGTCATANYELGSDGVVLVRNSQVLGQQLDVINGTAVLATDDNSAKLTVTFPIPGTDLTTSSSYWVLATDYINYALVYGCTNIDDVYSAVSSWKLSRTQTLTTESQTAINTVIESIQVLRQDYFEPSGHSEEECFYYPDNYGGPVILEGNCPGSDQVETVANFAATRFAGPWLEIARFPSVSQTGECATHNVEIIDDSFFVTQTIVNNERLVTSYGSGPLAEDGRGVLNFTADGLGLVIYVLDTDYEEFALLYGCVDVSANSKQIYSWKLGRNSDGLSQAANDRIDSVVRNNTDLFEGYYDITDQTNNGCFYYPVFDTLPSSIELPGLCDETIRGVSNFAAESYLGRWLEVERYPQPFQTGSCSRAEYAVVGGSVTVLNTEVVNRTLDSITGSAEVSPDGSGLLNVTFDIDGTIFTSDYYVLETDYNDYALVYTCENLPNGNRIVSSWKLSRSGTLSSAANAIIDQAIARTQGLIQDYYIPTSQSAEDCFYVPEVDIDKAPLFRGQCETIPNGANFNIQGYLGWWHEIESYPTDEVSGECTSSLFSSTGTNQFQVVDTSVSGLSGEFVTSSVQATADGRIRRTLSDGRVIDTWVLATDYTTYSLLYGCENVGDEYRRVWSAKHSKDRQLTSEAQAAMDAIIQENDLLYDQFYFTVNQADSACFHYPEQDGQRVILPGQCDENIPVEANFDAGLYTGTWYQIERYPQIHESGNCTGARYTLADDYVHVINWQISEEGVLDALEGSAVVHSTDGSAKLTVTLPVVGMGTNDTVTTQLYVLTTDYVSYSLTYSCTNVNQFQRAVGVWKLSRSRTISDVGNTAINAYMSTREEIHQPYFITVSQNEDCEEPNTASFVKNSLFVLLMCALLQVIL